MEEEKLMKIRRILANEDKKGSEYVGGTSYEGSTCYCCYIAALYSVGWSAPIAVELV